MAKVWIELDDDLVSEVIRVTGINDPSEAVEAFLREWLEIRRQAQDALISYDASGNAHPYELSDYKG